MTIDDFAEADIRSILYGRNLENKYAIERVQTDGHIETKPHLALKMRNKRENTDETVFRVYPQYRLAILPHTAWKSIPEFFPEEWNVHVTGCFDALRKNGYAVRMQTLPSTTDHEIISIFQYFKSEKKSI